MPKISCKARIGGLMRFESRLREGINDGSLTVTYRRWRRSQVVPGGRYRTGMDMIEVDSVELAIRKARRSLDGAAMASDAFFPFPDGPQAAIDAGVRAIIQPGGSKRDEEVIEACNAASVAMVFTSRRHFRH